MKLGIILLTTIFLTSLFLGFSQETKKSANQEEKIGLIQVSSGELEIIKKRDYHFIVSLNGKPIHENNSYILGIYRFYMSLGEFSVVLLDEISGGNICQAFSFRFIAWKRDGTYVVSKSFGNCQGPVIRQDGNKLIFIFKSYIGRISQKEHPSETWMFENGQLRQLEESQTAPKVPQLLEIRHNLE